MPRALLAPDRFADGEAKTATCILRFAPGTVTCVVDPASTGQRVPDVLGFGPDVPVVADAKEALDLGADELVVGIAPVGGELPDAWRPDLRAFLERGLTVTSGLHTWLGEDPELAKLAADHGATLRDLRKPPEDRRIASGRAGDLGVRRVYVSGTDCSSGKMTTAVALARAAGDRGLDAGFLATGQTGLLLDPDAGAPMDAVVSDFLAGEMERCVEECAEKGRDPVFIEGQGALSHPGYGQVTMGMVLGCYPTTVVMSHVPGRHWREGFPEGTFEVPSLAEEIALTEQVLERTSCAKVAAVALNTWRLTDEEAKAAVERAEAETGLVAADPIRGDGEGAEALLDAVLEAEARRERGTRGDGRAASADRGDA